MPNYSNFSEWKYVKEKFNDYANALDAHYSDELKNNPELMSAVMDIKKANRVIDSIMAELAEKESADI